MQVRNIACETLLQQRVELKINSGRVGESVLNKLHVAEPMKRDEKARQPFVPDCMKHRVKYDKEDPMRAKLERDLEAENGGAGVFNVDLNSTPNTPSACLKLIDRTLHARKS